MLIAFEASRVLSIVLFLFYGITVLVSDAMVEEFKRFGLSRFRTLTGDLEVAGAIGLIVGYFIPVLVVFSSAGLSLLMGLGIATRVRVKDPVLDSAPAAFLLCVNLFVCAFALGWV